MFYVLSKILDLAFAPLTWVLALIAFGAVTKRPRARLVALGAGFALLFICSLQPVANRFLRFAELPADRTFQPEATYDAVIVLGGFIEGAVSESAGSNQYNSNVDRLLTAYDLLRTGRAKQAILSGGVTEGTLVEGAAMAEQLEAWGIDKDRLLIESASKNTRENAVESAKIARAHGLTKLLLVTSAFHMPRAHGCFRARDVNLDVDTLPTDFRSYDPAHISAPWTPRAQALQDTTAILRELSGRVIYRIRGFSAAP